MDLIQDVKEITELTDSVEDCGGVYFVPAFSGLYAPYWKKEARGYVLNYALPMTLEFFPYVICLHFFFVRIIYGLTENTQRGHIMRATLEAVCFQVRDILEAMSKDCNFRLVQLQVDGGMTANKLLLQLQSDLVGLEVKCPKMAELSALVRNQFHFNSIQTLNFN